jgi:hypothetical protein
LLMPACGCKLICTDAAFTRCTTALMLKIGLKICINHSQTHCCCAFCVAQVMHINKVLFFIV